MKRRIYATLDGGTVTMLRPDTPAEAQYLEESYRRDKDSIDARHSLADERDDEPLDSIDDPAQSTRTTNGDTQ